MKKIVFAVITGVLFIAEIFLLKIYDVAAIGAGGTNVGFSSINLKVHELTGVNLIWYDITNYIGYFAIAVCMVFALAGLIQWIRRKNILAVDREILSLGGLFAADIALYVLFEKLIINYRPVFMDGSAEPEASFPSSHTILGITVMIAVAIVIGRYIRSETLAAFIRFLCIITAIVAVGGRLYSGVHWFTDITGGVLISASFLLFFSAAIGDRDEDPFSYSRRKSTIGYVPKH